MRQPFAMPGCALPAVVICAGGLSRRPQASFAHLPGVPWGYLRVPLHAAATPQCWRFGGLMVRAKLPSGVASLSPVLATELVLGVIELGCSQIRPLGSAGEGGWRAEGLGRAGERAFVITFF